MCMAAISLHRKLCQVLTDNAAMCRKLTEDDLRKIFKLATSSDNLDHFELCYTLQAAIQVLVESVVSWLDGYQLS